MPASPHVQDEKAAPDTFLQDVGRRWSQQGMRSPRQQYNIEPDVELYEEDEDTGGGTGVVRFARNEKPTLEREEKTGYLRATVRAERPTEGFGRAIADIRSVLLGAPLATQRLAHERLTKVKALAVLSSDALSSVAYATEQQMAVLVLAGFGAFSLSIPLGIAVVLLLVAVGASYRQTIRAYPKGGGSYIVAKDNLGALPGLTAASALMTDYILTVAVSVSAGIAAVTSAAPELQQFTVELGLVVIALIVLGNLRGIREAGSIFSIPTYLFIAGMVGLVGFGLLHLFLSGPANAYAHQSNVKANVFPVSGYALSGVVGAMLIARAFASGCTALTGVEAISDGVPAFKQPEWRNARTTLTLMVLILAGTYFSITFLAHQFHLAPDFQRGGGLVPELDNPANYTGPYQSVLSKLAHVVFGTGPVYIYIQATTALILVLAANTSFSDFPRLLYFLARDKYAPAQFTNLGDRLSFSNGIILLGVLAGLLYAIFRGSTDALIPLYTIGVFLSFTLSQLGMVARWRRLAREGSDVDRKGWRASLAMNLIGAVCTAIVLVIAAATKFLSGAWIVIVLIPLLVTMFMGIHRHYRTAGKRMQAETPLTPGEVHPVAVVPINDLTDVTMGTLALARRLAEEVIAVYISDDQERIRELQAKWQRWGNHVQLQIIESPYRSIVRPLLTFLNALEDQLRGHTLMVVLPELVHTRWWHQFLHNQTALRLKAALLFRPGTVVVNVPYHLREDRDHDHRRDDDWAAPHVDPGVTVTPTPPPGQTP